MILVTGGTGLVGSHLLYELLNSGEKVKVLIRKESKPDFIKKVFSWYSDEGRKYFDEINWVNGNLLDIFSIEDALKDVDKIYNCAAMVSLKPEEKDMIMKTNIVGTANLVNAALHKGIDKICHVSSIAALGKTLNSSVITEKSNWINTGKKSVYGLSKYLGEQEVWRGIEEGLDAVIVNPSFIIGPGNWNNGSAKIFQTVWDGMPFYPDGCNGYVDVKDVSKVMIRLMKSGIKNERFIISAGNIPYKDLLIMIANNLGKKSPFIKINPLLGKIGWRFDRLISVFGFKTSIQKEVIGYIFSKYNYSNDKIKKAINYSFIPIEKSIEQTAEIFIREISDK